MWMNKENLFKDTLLKFDFLRPNIEMLNIYNKRVEAGKC